MYIYIKSSQRTFEMSYNFICQLYLGKAVEKKDGIPWYGIGPIGRGSYRMTDFSSVECRIGWFYAVWISLSGDFPAEVG